MLTASLIIAALLAVWTYYKIQFRFANKIPSTSQAWPVFGDLLQLVNNDASKFFSTLCDAFRESDRIFQLKFGPVPVICPTHPDLIQKVLTDTASMAKPFFYGFFRLDKGLVSAEYENWKGYRKVLNSSFNTRILNSFIPIFTDGASKMVQSMKEHSVLGNHLNIIEFTFACTLGIGCRTTLGSKVLEREGTQEAIEGLECTFHYIAIRIRNFLLFPYWLYQLTPNYRAEKKARKCYYGFADKIILERQEYMNQKSSETHNNQMCFTSAINQEEDDMISYKKPQIVIDQLLKNSLPNGKPFSHLEMRDNLYTIIAAAVDTSAIQTAQTALLLAQHPEIQEKAVTELKEVFSKPDTEYSPEILGQLTYLERIIKESLRLCPAVGIFARETLSDLQLDEYVIPKGNIVVLNVFDLHRRKDFWGEDAASFNPDRFLPENSKNRHPFAYLPFSGGPRGCIGNRYAVMSLKVMLAEILRNFVLTTDTEYEEMKFEFKLTLQLTSGYRIFLEPRIFYRSTN